VKSKQQFSFPFYSISEIVLNRCGALTDISLKKPLISTIKKKQFDDCKFVINSLSINISSWKNHSFTAKLNPHLAVLSFSGRLKK
jgi:hypothetical protein